MEQVMKKNKFCILLFIAYVVFSSHCFSEVVPEYVKVVSEYFLALENNDIESYALLNSTERLSRLRDIGLENALDFERKTVPKIVSWEIRNMELSSVFIEVRGVVGDNYVPKGIVRVNKTNYIGIFELKVDVSGSAGAIRVQNYSYGVSSFTKEDSL